MYSISLGMLLREPVFRAVIAGVLGLEAAAAYDIGLRISSAAREVIASGFSVLYPVFSYLYSSQHITELICLARVCLVSLLAVGTITLGELTLLAEPVLGVWLPNPPVGAVDATRILAVWQFVTLLNVPFWFLLQATGKERAASLSLWAHTAAILALIPASHIVTLSLSGSLVYWTSSAIITQLLIYYSVEHNLGIFWQIVVNWRVACQAVVAALYGIICLYFWLYPGRAANTVIAAALSGIGLVLVSWINLAEPVSRFRSRRVMPRQAGA